MAPGALARILPLLLRALGVGLTYVVLARLSDRLFYFDPARFLAFWLPAGFTLALLLRTRLRTWPVWLAAIFVAEVAHQLTYPRPLGLALAWGVADTLEPLLGASLMRLALRRQVTLSHPREVLALVGLGALVPAMASGVIASAAAMRWLPEDSTFLTWWSSWWTGDALGVVLVGPFFLTALPPPALSRSRKMEGALLLGLLALLTEWVFTGLDGSRPSGSVSVVMLALYATFGFLVWAALRFGVPGVATATVVLAGVAGWATGQGLSPFRLGEVSTHTMLLSTQGFLALFGILALMLAAALNERRQVEQGQRLLADVSKLLAEGLSEQSLALVAQRLVPTLADACVLSLQRDPHGLEPVGVAGTELSLLPLLPPRPPRAGACPEGEPREEPVPPGVQLTVPLCCHGRVLGQLALYRASAARGFDAGARALATELAHRCALMVERCQLYRTLGETARHAEESLARLDTVLQTAPIGFAFFDASLRCVRANSAFSGLLGLQGTPPVGRLAEELRPGLEPLLRRTLERGEPVLERELEGPTSGEGQHLLVSSFPVRGAGRDLLGVGLLVQDVTDRRRVEEFRTRLFQEAQAALRARDEFLTVAAHELKTPLTPVALRLETLERRLASERPEDARSLHRVRTHLRRLQLLIEHLLEAARIDTGHLSIHLAPTPIHEVVRAAHAAFRSASPRHRVEVDTQGTTAWVLGDRFRLEQVLTSLLENAIKYSPEGGTIRVVLRVEEEEVRLAVSDPGVGIPPEQQEHVFERYFRGRNVPVQSYGGLGLGLFICRSIVESHGGRISVESAPGQGSTFTLVLPLLRAARHPQEPAPGAVLH